MKNMAKSSGAILGGLIMAGVLALVANSQPEGKKFILNVDPGISEAIKWNAPSFRTTDFFATVNLRSRDCVQLIFHTGARVKATATTGISIADPAGLLEWLAKDRCLVTLGVGKDIQTRRAAFEAIVREWIRWV